MKVSATPSIHFHLCVHHFCQEAQWTPLANAIQNSLQRCWNVIVCITYRVLYFERLYLNQFLEYFGNFKKKKNELSQLCGYEFCFLTINIHFCSWVSSLESNAPLWSIDDSISCTTMNFIAGREESSTSGPYSIADFSVLHYECYLPLHTLVVLLFSTTNFQSRAGREGLNSILWN